MHAVYLVRNNLLRYAHRRLSPRYRSRRGLNQLSILPRKWIYRIERNELLVLRTTTKEPLPLKGLILLYLHAGNLCSCIWIGVEPHFAVNSLHCTSFIDRFILGIFSSERKVVRWNSQRAAIMTHRQVFVHQIMFHTILTKQVSKYESWCGLRNYASCMIICAATLRSGKFSRYEKIALPARHWTKSYALKTSQYAH